MKRKQIKSPLIKELLAHIECKVVDIFEKHSIIVLEDVAAYIDGLRKERRTLHAIGEGTFVVEGRQLNRRKRCACSFQMGVKHWLA